MSAATLCGVRVLMTSVRYRHDARGYGNDVDKMMTGCLGRQVRPPAAQDPRRCDWRDVGVEHAPAVGPARPDPSALLTPAGLPSSYPARCQHFVIRRVLNKSVIWSGWPGNAIRRGGGGGGAALATCWQGAPLPRPGLVEMLLFQRIVSGVCSRSFSLGRALFPFQRKISILPEIRADSTEKKEEEKKTGTVQEVSSKNFQN